MKNLHDSRDTSVRVRHGTSSPFQPASLLRRMTLLFLVVSSALLLSGCLFGTVVSRGGRSPLGKYPFQAVGADVVAIVHVSDPPHETSGAMLDGKPFAFWGFISLPLDMVIDVALLPLDLILWPFGCEKS